MTGERSPRPWISTYLFSEAFCQGPREAPEDSPVPTAPAFGRFVKSLSHQSPHAVPHAGAEALASRWFPFSCAASQTAVSHHKSTPDSSDDSSSSWMSWAAAGKMLPEMDLQQVTGLKQVEDAFQTISTEFFLAPLRAGVAFMAISVIADIARSSMHLVGEWLASLVVVRLQVDSRTEACRWLLHWLSAHSPNSRSISAISSRGFDMEEDFGGRESGKAEVRYVPAPGTHALLFRGRCIWVSRECSSAPATLEQYGPPPPKQESLNVAMLGRSTKMLKELVEEARELFERGQRERTQIFSAHPYEGWMAGDSQPSRSLSSVILPPGMAEAIHADCNEFCASEAWYTEHGVPYRRGFLLSGPPGTGKSSLVRALAGSLGLRIYVVYLSSSNLSDDRLRELLCDAASPSILLLEDIDAAFSGRKSGGRGAKSLTFSGLLNALDGVAAPEGKLLFMTTNHEERLDAALVRPGRVDVRCKFKLASQSQARRLFLHFYRYLVPAPSAPALSNALADTLASSTPAPKLSDDASNDPVPCVLDASVGVQVTELGGKRGAHTLVTKGQQWTGSEAELNAMADQFTSAIPDDAVSPAALQGLLMLHKNDPFAAIADLPAFLLETRSEPIVGDDRMHDTEEDGASDEEVDSASGEEGDSASDRYNAGIF